MVQLEETTYHEILRNGRAQAEKICALEAEVNWYKTQFALAQKQRFGPSSEKSPAGQEQMVFNEAEAEAAPTTAEPEAETETVTFERRKATGKREEQLSKLPVEEIDYDLSEDEQTCPNCAGSMHKIGVEVRQEIKIIPAKVILVKHKRGKYACRGCEDNGDSSPIVVAPAPKTAFPNSLASPSSVAYIMSQKFVEGMPLYRQEQSLERLGFDLSRQTMANWMLAGADWLEQITRRMKTRLFESDILHADETVLQVLKEEGRRAEQKSYMWMYRSGRDGPPIVLYEYQETRAAKHPRTFLAGYTGYMHVDGYASYDGLPGVILVGCWAHARRNFVEAIEVLTPMTQRKGGTAAHEGMEFITKLFAIETSLRDVTPQERYAGRMARSKPLLDDFRAWLEEMAIDVTPKSHTGKAIRYCLNQWSKLITFLADGRLEITNNRAERSIKPFVIGRKNWLFADTPRGADASATIYSIVETAKENGINPSAYIAHLFEQLPNMNWTDPESLDVLMPWSAEIQERFSVPVGASK